MSFLIDPPTHDGLTQGLVTLTRRQDTSHLYIVNGFQHGVQSIGSGSGKRGKHGHWHPNCRVLKSITSRGATTNGGIGGATGGHVQLVCLGQGHEELLTFKWL